MAEGNNDMSREPASPSRIHRLQTNASRGENSVDLVRLFKVFKALFEIIKPPSSKADIMKNRAYYLATHSQRYKLEEENQAVQKWTKDSNEYAIGHPCSLFVPDTDSPPRFSDPDAPIPFEIKDNWDRDEATKRIKELYKELDEILENKSPPNHANKANLTARLNLARQQELRQQMPPPPANDDRYKSEEDLSEILETTRIL
ncbi:uncharacterized protein LOC123668596 [Melitaea cinxia]|uniref:uncharacterized protein LOC123668596 n=1 Tax=Melitaea cinxia TaxID=113334 RepID=UPI001E270BAD|nr:uncharacterized protein LOC123668596 [Melitaea cinxia]